jgi:hypothetical protein
MTKDELSTISTIVEQLQAQSGLLAVAYWKLDKIVRDNSSGE